MRQGRQWRIHRARHRGKQRRNPAPCPGKATLRVNVSQRQNPILEETQYPYRPALAQIMHNGIGCRWVNLGAGIETMTQTIFERHQRLSGNRFDFFPAIPQPGTKPFPGKTPPHPDHDPQKAT